jgi:hypothetical protein
MHARRRGEALLLASFELGQHGGEPLAERLGLCQAPFLLVVVECVPGRMVGG